MPQRPPRKRRLSNPLDGARGHEVVWSNVASLFGETRDVVDRSFVYIIGEHEDTGPLKIGVAKDPIKRLRSMQTGNPRRLRVEWILVGERPLEQLLHQYWEPFAIVSALNRANPEAAPGTEWFRSEIRERLYPILETAALKQLDALQQPEMPNFTDLVELVREAHVEHDFVLKLPDETRLMAAGAGYITSRAERLTS